MKRLTLLLLAALMLATGVQAADTTRLVSLYGKLVRATSGLIEVQNLNDDGTTTAVEVAYTQDTQFFGCTPDSVQAGTNTFVFLSDADADPRVAAFIQFDGCFPQMRVGGTILSVNVSSVVIETETESEFGPAGTSVEADVTAGTEMYGCSGQSLTISQLEAGARVVIAATGDVSDPVLRSLQRVDDCPQYQSTQARFVSVVDSVMTFVTPDGDTLALRLDPRYFAVRNPLDSGLGFYVCDGSFVLASDLRQGSYMTVTYVSDPAEGTFLQWAYINEGCPMYARVTVTAINGNSIIAEDDHNTSYAFAIDSSTVFSNCRGEQRSLQDIVVGAVGNAQSVASNNTFILQSFSLLEDCPYAFSAAGIIKEGNASSVTITTTNPTTGEPEDVTLNFDADTRLADCLYMPVDASMLAAGNSAIAYYRTANGARVADIVFVTSPCNTSYVSGVISNVANSMFVVTGDDGSTSTFVVDDNSAIVDCRGDAITISSALEGDRIEGYSSNTGSGNIVTKASVYVNCLQFTNVSGVVANSDDSSVTVTTAQGSRTIQRSPNSIIVDDQGMLQDWSALTDGRSVCMWVDESLNSMYYATLDMLCSNANQEEQESAMVIGRAQDMNGDRLTVRTKSGEMTFAITPATQMMDEKRNVMSASSLSPGMSVRVVTKAFSNDRLPIATSVVASATIASVDDGSSSDLQVVPNPASSIVRFSSSAPYDVITITDLLGNRVADLRNATSMDVSGLATGMYVVSAQRGTRLVVTKLQIQR